MPERRFPVQGDWYRNIDNRMVRVQPMSVPWQVAEIAYAVYRTKNGGHQAQSLDTLAQRGGFGRDELLDLLSRA